MKKIVLTFSLAALVLTGTISCSSDDNSSEQQQKQTLVLASANGTDVTVNEEVTFVVTVGTEVIKDVQIEVNGKKVTNPHFFTEAGTYKVVAKKNGYNTSNELTITVSEVGIAKMMTLTADQDKITVGEAVTFTVKEGDEVLTGADFYMENTKISNPFTFTQEGEFIVIAKKAGYADSNRVTIRVKGIEKTLKLAADRENVSAGDRVTFTVTEGTEVVPGAELFIGEARISSPHQFTEAGVYEVIAKKQGYLDSNHLTITVAAVDARPIVGTWIPMHVKVDAFGSTVADMPYPKKENCADDTLTFNSNQTVKFDYHEENCTIQSTGANWSINPAGSVLTMNLFGQSMTVNVVENTATKLVIKAKGDQFAALIPILVPDLAGSLPPALLALTDVQLELKK